MLPTLPAMARGEQGETVSDEQTVLVDVQAEEVAESTNAESEGVVVEGEDAAVKGEDAAAADEGASAGLPTDEQAVDETVGDASGEIAPSEQPVQDPLAAPTDTTEPVEAPDAKTTGWANEGGSYYYYINGAKQTGWVVTDEKPQGGKGSLQRYWLDGEGRLAMGRLISDSEAGYWAYALSNGEIVRGYHKASNGYVYLASNDGRLEGPGWVISSAYGQGLQRYYVDPDAHACIPGYSDNGYAHYTLPEGYVVRGRYVDSNGRVYLATNEGKLEGPGWVISSAYGQGIQRYYVDPDAHACIPGYSAKGYPHYTLPEGYVVRGKYTASNGRVYLAKNDGRLENDGWVITNAYDGEIQRYYVEPSVHACVPGYSAAGFPHYTLAQGYVARGKYTAPDGKVYLANNDGRLANDGWVISRSYGDGLQRYYVDPSSHACVPGYSTKGWPHYTRPEGYVARGKYVASNNRIYLANNDGRLEADGWLVSSAYGDGLQRYYIDPSSHACVPGHSEKGWCHYTRPEGYVARGRYTASNGYVYLANNDGRLEKPGWLVTSAYGQGLQRYWIDESKHCCVPGYSSKGWGHYTHPEGYVVRGAYRSGNTLWLADNNGRLANNGNGGWLVTSSLGHGLQRYYIDPSSHGIKLGLGREGNWWFYTRPEGYVVRGAYRTGDNVYLADNDGRLPSSTANSWVVTNAYGQGLQRYYIYGSTHAARVGYSTDGYPHYTLSAGYVLREPMTYGGGVLLADNDGRLATRKGWLETSAYGQGYQRYYLDSCCNNGRVGARTGVFTVGSSKYYGYPGKGYIARNTDVNIAGVPYRANSRGELTSLYPASITNMANRANNYSSRTNWLIMIDRGATKMCVFYGSQGNWRLNRYFDISVGAPSTPTVAGTFRVGSRGYSFGEDKGYSCYYWVQIYSDYLMHSVKYYPNTRTIQDGRLNAHISNGCVRMGINNAKWIYDNIPSGTTINIV